MNIDTPDTPPAVARLYHVGKTLNDCLSVGGRCGLNVLDELHVLRGGINSAMDLIRLPLEPAVPAGQGEAAEAGLPPLRCISREQYLAETSSAFDAAVKKRAAENPSTPPARDLEADLAVCNWAAPEKDWPTKHEEVFDGPCDDLLGWRAVGPMHWEDSKPELQVASIEQAKRDQLFARTARAALPFWLHEVRRLRVENAELRSRPEFPSIQAVLPPGVRVIRGDAKVAERNEELERQVAALEAELARLRTTSEATQKALAVARSESFRFRDAVSAASTLMKRIPPNGVGEAVSRVLDRALGKAEILPNSERE